MKKLGYDVYCIAPNDDEVALKAVTDVGVSVLPVKQASPIMLIVPMNLQALKILYSKYSDTVFVCHFVVTAIIMAPSLFLARRVVCVVEGIGTAFSKRKFLKKLLKFILGCLASKRVFMNDYERDEIGSNDDLVLGGIGVDLEKFKPAVRTLKNERDNINLLYVGRLVRDKGVYDLFILMRMLQENGVSFTMNIVGETYAGNYGSLQPEELCQAQEEFGQSLVFHGQLQSVTRLYQETDLFLLLSRHEGFPVCVMEANACGRPVFAYDVPGCAHAIKDSVNGRLFPLGEVNSIAEAIVSGQFISMRESARKYAENHFDRNVKADELISVIETLASSNK